MLKTIAPAAIAITREPRGEKILLTKRRDSPIWVLPGGAVEQNETPLEGAAREVFEETGIQVEPIRLLAHFSPINALAAPTYLVECDYKEGSLSLSPETTDVGFFAIDRLPYPLFPLHHRWIERFLEGHFTGADEPLEGSHYRAALGYLLSHPIISLRFLWNRLR